jgi:hypothetical protein
MDAGGVGREAFGERQGAKLDHTAAYVTAGVVA